MTLRVWLVRDADGQHNLYSLLTGPPLRRPDAIMTCADEEGECLAAFPPEIAEPLFGLQLKPGEGISGALRFEPEAPAQPVPSVEVPPPEHEG